MPQDPQGSGASSSSSSDLAESDERNDEDGENDEDDDGTTPTSLTTGIATDHTNNTHRPDEDRYGDRYEDRYEEENHYESVINDETCSLEYHLDVSSYDIRQRSVTDDPRYAAPRYRHQSECAETTLIGRAAREGLGEDSGGSDSANSLDDLCDHHVVNDLVDAEQRRAGLTNPRDQYMVPTRSPRELNARILSLFNPQFLPNFNNMITYMAGSPPLPRSHHSAPRYSCEEEDDGNDYQRGTGTNYRKRDAATNSMCFRRGLTYDAPRK